jgi:hypothetical protein
LFYSTDAGLGTFASALPRQLSRPVAVTYGRAARYPANQELVPSNLDGRTRASARAEVRFLNADETTALPLPEADLDLLISLYTGPVWDHCQHYLTPSGLFLANSSHGDARLVVLC